MYIYGDDGFWVWLGVEEKEGEVGKTWDQQQQRRNEYTYCLQI